MILYFWQCYEVIDAGGSQIRDVQEASYQGLKEGKISTSQKGEKGGQAEGGEQSKDGGEECAQGKVRTGMWRDES